MRHHVLGFIQSRNFQRRGQFFKYNELSNFTDGQKICQSIHTHMIEFDERQFNYKDKLKGVLKHFGKKDFYVGLSDTHEEGIWQWTSSGRILTHSENNPWDDGEPNNINHEDCATIQSVNLLLIDVKCSKKSTIICEKSQEV